MPVADEFMTAMCDLRSSLNARGMNITQGTELAQWPENITGISSPPHDLLPNVGDELMFQMCRLRSAINTLPGVSIPQGLPLAAWPNAIKEPEWEFLGSVQFSNPQLTSSPIDTSGATLLVACTTGCSLSGMTDSKGNQWQQAVVSSAALGGQTAQIYYTLDLPATGPNHTFIIANSCASAALVGVFRCDRLVTLEQTVSAVSANSNVLLVPQMIPAKPWSLYLTVSGSTVTITGVLGSNLNLMGTGAFVNAVSYAVGAAYSIAEAIVPISPTWTLMAATGVHTAGAAAIFSPI